MAAEWDVYADWDGNGNFTTWGDRITGRILDGRTQLSITYGKDQSRALSPTRVGDASFEVSNVSGDYSPELSTSPLYGKVLPSRPVKIEAVLNSTTYTPFRGRTDDFTVKLGADELSDRLADLRAADPTLIHRARTPRPVALIAESGFDVDARLGGRTALHEAAFAGDLELTAALLAGGANPDAVDDQFGTPPRAR
jgi:hypothetical protein